LEHVGTLCGLQISLTSEHVTKFG